MKKLKMLFVLLISFLTVQIINAQTTSNLGIKQRKMLKEEITRVKKINLEKDHNEKLIEILSKLKIFSSNLNIHDTKTIQTSITKSIITSIPLKNSKYNYVSILENSKLKTPLIFFHSFKNGYGTSKIFDENGNELYKLTKNRNNMIEITINSNLPVNARLNKNFSECMDQCETEMESDFTGWLAWNYSPGVQLTCATLCAVNNNWMND